MYGLPGQTGYSQGAECEGKEQEELPWRALLREKRRDEPEQLSKPC